MSDLIERVAESMHYSSSGKMFNFDELPEENKIDYALEATAAIQTVLEEMLKDRTSNSLFRWNVEKFAMKHGITLEKEQ